MATDVSKFHFRLVLLGSHGTGKTSILNRFLFKKFETKYRPTVEDLFTKDFDLGSIEIKVDFLDTSGSMQFPAMRRLSITTGSAFLIVYALDDESSFEVLKMCIAEIQEIRPDFQEIPIVFAGNKCDIPRERRKVLKEVVSNYVHYELPARLRAKVIECSCRDSINIDNLFKAYLSLAKVRVSSSAPMAPPSSANSIQQQHQQQTGRHQSGSSHALSASVGLASGEQCCNLSSNLEPAGSLLRPSSGNGRRSSSMKDALGVRKSCDASILPSCVHRKSAHGLFTTSSITSAGQKSENKRIEIQLEHQQSPHDQDQEQQQQQQGEVMNLERAIQSKLSVSQASKPRSRSLIWRPARKSRTAAEGSDCRVT